MRESWTFKIVCKKAEKMRLEIKKKKMWRGFDQKSSPYVAFHFRVISDNKNKLNCVPHRRLLFIVYVACNLCYAQLSKYIDMVD